MVRRFETDPVDRDEQLGEAIEAFLALAEGGEAPDPEDFAARYPDLNDDLRAALEGLALVRGLVGDGGGPGHRLESGRRIAGYRIVRELGRGGMGTVYEAVHVGLDRPVALKVLGTHAAPDSTGRRRFLNEARTAAGLHHTHIVPVFDVGQVGGLCYYAMQRIEGSGLDSVLRHLRRDRTVAAGNSQGGTTSLNMSSGRRGWTPRFFNRSGLTPIHLHQPDDDNTATWVGRSHGDLSGSSVGVGGVGGKREQKDEPPPFDPPRGSAYYRWVAEVGREAAEALAHAHRRGIIHRDIKPSNLLVDARGIVWVADFGLARRLSDPGLTQHDSLLGTPRYMSPEQAKTGAIDGRSDVYSLGATLYELLTLRPPFQGQTAAELVAQIGSKDPVAPRQYDNRIPRDLETIVIKALAKRPEDRYATAMDFAEDLERFQHHEPVRARRISSMGRLWRFMKRNPTTSIVSATAAAMVLIVTSLAFFKVVHERDQTRAAIRSQLWRESSVVRLSNLPNRRATGLALLKEAAAMGPEPALRTRLRNEAVEFLMLRNVEARPDFPTGPARAITFGPEGARLASLPQLNNESEVDEITFWEVATREPIQRHKLNLLGQETGPIPGGTPGQGGRQWRPSLVGLTIIGQCIAVLSPDGQGVQLFDSTTGAKLRDLKMPGRHLRSLLGATDGQHFVTVEAVRDPAGPGRGDSQGRRDGRNDPWRMPVEVCLYDMEQPSAPIATLMHWEPKSGPDSGIGYPIASLSPDGRTVATAGARESTVFLWSAENGRPLDKIETQTELVTLTLGPSNLLATAGNGAVRLWELDSKTSLPGFTPYQSSFRILRFNPRGTLLAVGGGGNNVELWDPAALNDAVAILTTPESVVDIAFSPDGQNLAASIRGSSATTAVWTIDNPVARVQLGGFEGTLSSLAFRSDGLLAMSSVKGVVRTWKPGQCPGALQNTDVNVVPSTAEFNKGNGRPNALVFDDQDRIVTFNSESLIQTWIGSAESKSEPPSQLQHVARLPHSEGRGGPMRGGRFLMFPAPLARVLGGQTLYIGRDSQVLVWRSNDPEQVRPLLLPAFPVKADHETKKVEPPRQHNGRNDLPPWRQIVANAQGDRLYLLSYSGEAYAVTYDGSTAQRLDWDLPDNLSSLAISPDGATLAYGDNKGNVALVRTSSGKSQTRLRTSTSEVEGRLMTMTFSPDGHELAVSTGQGPIEIWSTSDTSAPILRLPNHRGIVNTMAYDPKGRYLATGRYLASGGTDKSVDVWDLDRIRAGLDRIGLAW
ncbi:WD40 repeat domain-containing serine/threonine protein kinase [Singulisphaera sp. PoT]|uniref:WD40 repeat domain-containing serine/threonine protein kinase n=1 Tax=Singulisphaera sp. PoT TaxID=3411797 RepID=UPI003BF506F1